jgi:hypothetical protein
MTPVTGNETKYLRETQGNRREDPNGDRETTEKSEAYLGYGRQGKCHGRHWQGAFGSFGYQHFRIDTFLLILTYVYIKKFMSMKPNPKEINIILNILKGAQFEVLPRAPFFFKFWFVRLLALRPLVAYCASLG